MPFLSQKVLPDGQFLGSRKFSARTSLSFGQEISKPVIFWAGCARNGQRDQTKGLKLIAED